MGNFPSFSGNHSPELHERFDEKIQEAVQSKWLRLPSANLRHLPAVLPSGSLPNLNETLKGIDLHSNELQYFPALHLPNLTSLNLWGNNMLSASFDRRTVPRRDRSRLPGRNFSASNVARKRSSGRGAFQLDSPNRDPEELKADEMEGPFAFMPKLDSLDLGLNQMTYLPPSIAQCAVLSQLTLTGNFLTGDNDLTPLMALSQLNSLDLDLNRLTCIPAMVYTDKKKLYTLLLRGNRIEVVPMQISQLEALSKLSLADNVIKEIEQGAFNTLTQLKTLYLFNNLLCTLPPDFASQLGSLTTLYLQHNLLEHLPPLHSLASLRELNVSHNKLTSLPSVEGLTSLTQLDLSHNRLNSLPVSFGALSQLRSLDASFNELYNLPVGFARLQRLTRLNLSGNCFTTGGNKILPHTFDEEGNPDQPLPVTAEGLQPLWSLGRLEEVYLALNFINSLPSLALKNLTRLATLNLAHNNISLKMLPLTTFEEEDQSLETSEEKEEPYAPSLAIRALFLNGNKIRSFPLTQLLPLRHTLETLCISGNPIESLPSEISQFTKLKYLALTVPPKSALRDRRTRKRERRSRSTTMKYTSYRLGCLQELSLSSLYVGTHYAGGISDFSRSTLNDPPPLCDESGVEPSEDTPSNSQRPFHSAPLLDSSQDATDIMSTLQYTDVPYFDAFPAFSCAAERVGSLKDRPYGYALVTGSSHDLEDCVHFATIEVPSCSVSMDVIHLFDGHGGVEAALFIQKHLAQVVSSFVQVCLASNHLTITESEETNNAIGRAIINAYIDCDRSLKKEMERQESPAMNTGSTSLTIILVENMLYCANAGDSRAVLATFCDYLPVNEEKADEAVLEKPSRSLARLEGANINYEESSHPLSSIRVSFDHKPSVDQERRRVRRNGGALVASMTGSCSYRLAQANGPSTLAVARAFGDFQLRPYVSVEPDIFCHRVDAYDQFIVMGSDGLWDVIPDRSCVDIVTEILHQLNVEQSIPLKEACHMAASEVRDLAHSLGSQDDISVIIIPLNWNHDNVIDNYFLAPEEDENSSGSNSASKSSKKKKKKKKRNFRRDSVALEL